MRCLLLFCADVAAPNAARDRPVDSGLEATAPRDHRIPLIALIDSAHHLSANGLRNTLRILMTLPPAVATLYELDAWW